MYWRHLQQVNVTYWTHMKFSLGLARTFAGASWKAVVHAILPDVYITSSTDTVETLTKTLPNHSVPNHKFIDCDDNNKKL